VAPIDILNPEFAVAIYSALLVEYTPYIFSQSNRGGDDNLSELPSPVFINSENHIENKVIND
jgi:hypothetical protein